MLYHQELQVALAAVREAARLCQTVQHERAAHTLDKKDRSPVTVADFGSQALVCRTLHEAFPNDPIIAEEDASALLGDAQATTRTHVAHYVSRLRPEATEADVLAWINYGGAQTYSDRFWTLDPIDGTKGFLRGQQYAVALALIIEGRVTVAALACPNLSSPDIPDAKGQVYAAVRGQGAHAYALPHSTASGAPIRTSTVPDSTQARFCESYESGHSAHDQAAAIASYLGIAAEPARLDSQAKYAIVARGGADIYLRLPTRPGYVEKIWDHAAGSLIVEEAGGTVTDSTGQPLAFNHGWGLHHNRGIIATNGHLHDDVLAAVQATLP